MSQLTLCISLTHVCAFISCQYQDPKPRAFCLYVMEGVSHTTRRMVGYYSDAFMRVINTAQVI